VIGPLNNKRQQALYNKAVKEAAMARYEERNNPKDTWEKLLDGRKFESYTIKMIGPYK
tara:strand:+ start:1052 stop:1225 length:174 start_codon:yes stop_codon:yes gene_type:complete